MLLASLALSQSPDTGLVTSEPAWISRAAESLAEVVALAAGSHGHSVEAHRQARALALGCTEADARVARLLEWAPERLVATSRGPVTVAELVAACRARVEDLDATPAEGCGARLAWAESAATSGGAWSHTRYVSPNSTRWAPLSCDRVEPGALPAGVSARAALEACGPEAVAVRAFDWVYVRDGSGALTGRRARLICLADDLLTTSWDYDAPTVELPAR